MCESTALAGRQQLRANKKRSSLEGTSVSLSSPAVPPRLGCPKEKSAVKADKPEPASLFWVQVRTDTLSLLTVALRRNLLPLDVGFSLQLPGPFTNCTSVGFSPVHPTLCALPCWLLFLFTVFIFSTYGASIAHASRNVKFGLCARCSQEVQRQVQRLCRDRSRSLAEK